MSKGQACLDLTRVEHNRDESISIASTPAPQQDWMVCDAQGEAKVAVVIGHEEKRKCYFRVACRLSTVALTL